MLELYHNDMSTCAQKVRLTLAEKGLTWESRHLDLRAGDQQKPEYLKLNPGGVVPTIVDNGKVVRESTVIMEYLDDEYPNPSLRPADSYAKAHMRLWTKRLDEGNSPALKVRTVDALLCSAFTDYSILCPTTAMLFSAMSFSLPTSLGEAHDALSEELAIARSLVPFGRGHFTSRGINSAAFS
ncbi:MAG TPA: glutathione S-transferase family protein [Candidatus Binatia bacterium]